MAARLGSHQATGLSLLRGGTGRQKRGQSAWARQRSRGSPSRRCGRYSRGCSAFPRRHSRPLPWKSHGCCGVMRSLASITGIKRRANSRLREPDQNQAVANTHPETVAVELVAWLRCVNFWNESLPSSIIIIPVAFLVFERRFVRRCPATRYGEGQGA